MRQVEARVLFAVPDGVTDEQLGAWTGTLDSAAAEAVYGHDASGNELTFPTEGVHVELVVDARLLSG